MKTSIMGYAALVLVTLLAAACSGSPQTGIESLADTLNGETQQASADRLTATGFIETEEVSVVAETSGRVVAVHVDQADEVTAGQVVIELDDSLLRAERAQAEAAVSVAKANLADLLSDPTAEEITSAEAAINEAQASLAGVRRSAGQAWAIADAPQDVEVEIAAAQVAVTDASAQVEQARNQLQEVDYELSLVRDSDDDNHIANLELEREQAVAQLAAAEAQYEGAVSRLNALEAQRDNPVIEVAQARNASAQIGVAEARVQLAQAQYNLAVAEPLQEQIAILEGQIALAEAQVALIDAQIARLSLIAPIGGVVTTRSIAVGETASAGVPLLTIAQLDMLQLIVYISETEIGRVRTGATAQIVPDALPGETFTGEVVRIGREAEFTPRNVQTEEERVNLVFAVEIRIDNEDGRLKPGMPAEVTIETAD